MFRLMKHAVLLISVCGYPVFVEAAARTDLSSRASNLKIGMPRAEVIRSLGNSTWAITPLDKGEWALPVPSIQLELHWRNGNCNPVQVQFNASMRVTGWDEGRALCQDTEYSLVPGPAYACTKSDRRRFCQR